MNKEISNQFCLFSGKIKENIVPKRKECEEVI